MGMILAVGLLLFVTSLVIFNNKSKSVVEELSSLLTIHGYKITRKENELLINKDPHVYYIVTYGTTNGVKVTAFSNDYNVSITNYTTVKDLPLLLYQMKERCQKLQNIKKT
jgi:hypothetical protein